MRKNKENANKFRKDRQQNMMMNHNKFNMNIQTLEDQGEENPISEKEQSNEVMNTTFYAYEQQTTEDTRKMKNEGFSKKNKKIRS